MAEVKLLGVRASPPSKRVEIALKLKGIEYEFIEEDLSNKSPLLLEYNPVHKKVPVLVHNGKPISESVVILEYIDETWKHNPIMPPDPYERATTRFWAKFFDEKLIMGLWNACWCDEKDKARVVNEAHENLKILENEIKNKRFFGGDKIGLIDIVANFLGLWLEAAEEASDSKLKMLTQNKFPNICRWKDEYVNHNVIKETLPPKDELITMMRARFGGSK